MAVSGKQLTQDEIYQILVTYVETNNKCITANYLDLKYDTVDKYIKENDELLEELKKYVNKDFQNICPESLKRL